jgi:WD40 repeat protein
VVIALSAAAPGRAESSPVQSQQEPVSFYRQVRPILQANCAGCHQPAKAKGGYVLTEFSRLITAGDSEKPPIVPGKPQESFLVTQITPADGKAEMPSGKDPLHSTEIELIARWVGEGAKDDTPASAGRRYDAENPPRYSRPPVITALDYSPDGTLLAVAGFHEILLHRGDGSGLEARLIGMSERIQSVSFSPDGQWLAAAGGQPARMGEVQIWDVEKRQLKLSLPVGYDTVYGVSWSPDSRLVAFGCPDKTVRAIDAATGKQVLQQMAHEDWVLGTVFSTNGSHVISVGRDMTAKLTEVATQRFVDNITSITPGALRGGLQGIARHPARDEVLVGGSDGQPQIYQVFRQAARKIGDNAALLRKFPGMTGRIFSVDYSPDGHQIAAAAAMDGRGAVNLYAARFDPTIPDVLLEAYKKTSGEYSKEERDAIQNFTTAEVKLLHHIEVPTAPVYAVSFSPDGERIAAATGTGLILVFDAGTGGLQMVFAAAPQDSLADPAEAHLAALGAQPRTGPQAEFESLPKDVRVTGLEIQPASVTLKSRNERVQLLVTATLASGDRADVTRMARFDSPSEGPFDLLISPRGVLSVQPGKPLAADTPLTGKRTLIAELNGHRAELVVDLDLAHGRFDADFIQDINPMLSKLGCNAGTCHGAREGKNGFKLSLRGYDPIFDVRAMTDDHAARRVNLASPDESLMLLKATAAVPHEGGQRTTRESDDYAVLRQWIADGAGLDPASPRVTRIALFPTNPVVQGLGAHQQVRVIATYADGEDRDVTTLAFIESGNTDVATADAAGLLTTHRRGEAPILARHEGNYAATTLTVMGDRSGFEWAQSEGNNRIDELVAAKWRRMKILPSDLCTDAEFIRRVSLDLTGLPPTTQQVREFLENPRDQRSKRDALIERLLGSPEFVDHWANKWADLLQVNRKFLGVEGAQLFRDWIRQQIERNTPYDQFVQRILTASGSNREHPEASYWKILRDPAEAMENTTHLFLATRFNCNKCHDHPFERWTQDQYYQLAQFFAQVQLKKDDASGDRRIGGTAVEGARPLFEIVSDAEEGGVKHDRTGESVEPAFPFQVDFDLAITDGKQPSRREELAAWVTSPNNPYFAMSYVNRLWGYLLGTGLIEPLDDIRAGNPPSNPELLDHLTREFVESGFNTRHVLRQICQSRAYQLSIDTHRWNADDQINYSHALARRLPAEVLLDSVYRVTGAIPDFPGATAGTRAAQLLDPGVDLPSGFLANLGRPPRESACECERSNDIKLSSVMSLLSGPAVSGAIQDPENALARLVSREIDDGRLADELFLRILNRPPREEERTAVEMFSARLDREHERLRDALAEADAQWALRQPQLERERAEAIALAENALAAHMVQRAAAVAAAQRERLEKIAAAESLVQAYEPRLRQRLADWETSLDSNQLETAWIPLDPGSLNVGGSARLRKLPDGSVLSTASVGELPNYTVTAETPVAGITGIKLEVLPHADLPGFGPGHKDGDFFLAEFLIDYASRTNAEKFQRATIHKAAADHVARNLSITETFNGIREQGRLDGWSVGDQTGRPHWATFALEKPVGDTNGTVLKFSLIHAYEAPYEVGRFRLWVTTSPNPTEEGLPADLVPILKVPAHRRKPEQTEKLLAHIRSRDPAMLERDFGVELARKPLPEDERLKELERDLARASRPVPVDPVLLQLRQDAELSEHQLANRRLTAAQDLAWALINTPAFLFNH